MSVRGIVVVILIELVNRSYIKSEKKGKSRESHQSFRQQTEWMIVPMTKILKSEEEQMIEER